MDINKNFESLMGPHWDEHADSEGNQNQSLLGSNALLSDQNRKLNNAIRVGNEAEIIAKDTKFNLAADTEKFIKIKDNIGRIDREVSLSDKLLDIIKKNETRNRCLLYTVAFIIILGILLLVYFKIMK